MGFRLLIMILGFSLLGGVASAASKKNGKTKFENVQGKKVQIEKAEIVNDSPLETPESARIRQERQQMEMETEEEFIQKLEQARMEDERLRRQQLFEKELLAKESDIEDPFLEPESDLNVDRSSLETESGLEWEPVTRNNEVTTTLVVDQTDPETRFYISLGAGGLNHQANNTPDLNGLGGIGLGVALGMDFWLEGNFYYSFLESDRTFLSDEDIDQFGVAVNPKYMFGMSDKVVTPVIGAVLGYTRRQYNGGDNASNALDAGISAGIDVAINQAVKIGVEGRYMTTLDYEKDNALDSTGKAFEELATGRAVKPLEDFDYSLFMVNAKMTF